MIQEFKDFISKGSVLDLAVAVVLGVAFGAVVASFVNDILLQVIAAIGGQPDFSSLSIDLGDGKILYGSFLDSVISFVFIAGGVFLVVKVINSARRQEDEGEAAPTEAELLTEIRDLLRQRQG